jgi:DNA-binding winged helix-turn-helix (wHTH) protein/TolB-like protein/Tfp pilus assembly protein PilF
LPTSAGSSSVIRFGVFELNADTGELRKAGVLVRIQPQPFKVLVLLARRPGELISREAFRQELWQDDTFVDFDQGLNSCVSQIRSLLGDSADAPRYVETLPRRGYRFISVLPPELKDESREGLSAPVATTPVIVPERIGATDRAFGWLRSRAVIGGVILFGALLAVGWITWKRSGASADSAISLSTVSQSSSKPPRLVVLPFENLTGRQADNWLAAAFSDSLTFGLQSLSGVILINRERIVELFVQQGVPESQRLDARAAQRLSKLLGVRYYVHGSYQLVGDDVKVVAKLVDADSGQIRLQESVTDRLTNVLHVEDDLARKFASSLELGSVQITSDVTWSLDAYQAFIEARSLYANGNHEGAIEKAERALAVDPSFAQAWAVSSKAYSRLTAPSTFAGGTHAEYRRLAFETAQRAVTLDPQLYDGRTALALAYRENGAPTQWRAEARRAIEVNPRLAEAYVLLADSYFSAPGWGCGRDRDAPLAEQYYHKASELDPRFALAYGNLAIHLVWSGRPEEALAAVNTGLKEIPVNSFLLQTRAYVLERLDRLDDAETQMKEILKTRKDTVQDVTLLATIDLRRGNHDRSARLFEEALNRRRDTTTELATARGHFDANDVNGALPDLERAFAADVACVSWFQQSPAFAAARRIAQVQALVAKFDDRHAKTPARH